MPPRRRAPKARPLRCSYHEDGIRCRRNGTGNPPLCQAHELVLRVEADRAMRRNGAPNIVADLLRGKPPSRSDMADAISSLFESFKAGGGSGFARAAEVVWETPPRVRAPRPAAAPPPPPAPDPMEVKLAQARRFLFQDAAAQVTVEDVKARRRELARKYHPDKFPEGEKRVRATEVMGKINAAADLLIESMS